MPNYQVLGSGINVPNQNDKTFYERRKIIFEKYGLLNFKPAKNSNRFKTLIKIN